MAMTAKEHVEEIRRTKFSIGGEPIRALKDLHKAVQYLSAELYAKDVHFLMELIQNAEDNEYPEGVDPSLEFVITSKDITNTGAKATLLVFNNEKGFSRENIESICSVGDSTKAGLRKRGYIGEKGIGFKSVFLITAQPYIFSNGYQIKFNEKPCQHCNVGYIVPEWVENDPTLSAIQSVYGSANSLPATTLVLPLKPEKVIPVKDQLSSVDPEVLLFLSKIKRLSVREDNEDPRLNTVSAISISSEKDLVIVKDKDAELYTLHLTADVSGNDVDTECGYHMWKQRFPVKHENKVDVRSEVEEWVITLAFPVGRRLNRGASMPGIYSFLPTETVTNFPFVIQADFLLASSRENILWDNKWNQGILDCVPVAFMNAFTSLIKSNESAPLSTLSSMFWFLPINESSHLKLNHVRDAIKAKVMNEAIVPCESYTEQKLFRKPSEVYRLKPAFWSILKDSRTEGVSFTNISSHEAYLLASSFDNDEYSSILEFLDVGYVDNEWYAKCIASSNLVMGVSEDLYIQLLVFIAEEWSSSFHNSNIKNIPLMKYVGLDSKVALFKISACTNKLLAAGSDHISWLINCNTEFHGSNAQFFLPKDTQEAVQLCSKEHTLKKWLKDEVNVKFLNVYEYAKNLSSSISSDCKLAITYAHFLHNSLKNNYLQKHEVESLCRDMPIVDNYGGVTTSRSGVLVPANGSKWVELIGSNPWRQHNYVELGEDYARCASYFGVETSGEEVVKFLQDYVGASDVPRLSPPNAAIPTLSYPLTKPNALLLLQWLDYLMTLRIALPERFLTSIKTGSWLKITLNGSSGCRPPSESFMLDSSIGLLLQNGSVLVDIPLVDMEFYGDDIKRYREELKEIGVKFENKEACEFIGARLMSIAASSELTRYKVLSMLKFIQFLGQNYLSATEFINSIKNENWLRTSQGDMSPTDSVLYSPDWNAAKEISDIPFIDQEYYGNEILSFKKELELLGVVVKFDQECLKTNKLVSDHLKSSSSLTSLSSDAFLLMLRCIESLRSSDKVVRVLKSIKCLKTNLGYKFPSDCFLLSPDSEWGCLLKVFTSFPIVDNQFYGRSTPSIFSMSKELKKIGVMVEFEDASKEFIRTFKQQASSSSIRKENVFAFLKCYRKMKKMKAKYLSEFISCITEEEWLRTKLGDFRSPKDCILFGTDWEPISQISLLPFIDDSDNYYGIGIKEYREELKLLGVTTEFKVGAKFVADRLYLPQDTSSITPLSVFALLDCVKKEEVESRDKFHEKLSKKKWLKTHFGYKCPEECLLFSSDWESFLKRSDGPFIDEEFYGSRIGSYKDELKLVGVITQVDSGCKVLASYLECHSNFETINRIYIYLSEKKWEPAGDYNKKIWIPRGTDNGEWVDPQGCVLHDKNNLFAEELHVLEKLKYEKKIFNFFASVFHVKIHPSVDDYCKLWKKWESSGRQITNTECCAFWEFVASNWNSGTEETFNKNLSKLPVLDATSDKISLVDKCCVLHDKNNLFAEELHVLEKLKYEKKIFNFFASVFHVKIHPSVDDYCKLWKKWESSGRQITNTECCAFWEFVASNWNPKTEETFNKNLSKLPVLDDTPDKISLIDKCDILIGDDLFLMGRFQSIRPIFVWYPQPSPKSLTRMKLVDIYSKLGVRTLSESAQKIISDVDQVGSKPVNPSEKIVTKGLFKLILGFLADPKLKFEAERRHEMASRVLAVKAFETSEPMTVKYSLSFSSGDVLIEANRMIHWDKQNSKFFMQKLDRSSGYKHLMEYASHFGEVIAKGVIWENEELVPRLSELIRLGFLVEFDEEAVEFLLENKNLQIFLEDQEYLSSKFFS
ncbi:DNA binding,ATP binding protein [Artemisia annua]|uniref:DNA binding,ATP binding protein n=1 Tax=Artemisia annua TaxID=35608 RepID=A0A2U1LRP0_ARTAN|nr:DNA binding,ATP binding protein [Artemisia annua]